MAPMIAIYAVPVGRLLCAYFHTAAHPSREAAANAEKPLKIGITNATDLIDTRPRGAQHPLTL
jgi:hypothetical protein